MEGCILMKILALVLFVTFAVPVQADPALGGNLGFPKATVLLQWVTDK